MNPAAIILSGGASIRMGTPKALLQFEGETILDRLISVLDPHCSGVTVVLGAGANGILAGINRRDQAAFVVNDGWQAGQLSSLQCGLRANAEASAILYTPVDYPAIQGSTVAALAAAMEADTAGNLVFAPEFEGRHGHPVCFRSALIPELLALPASATARDVFHNHRAKTKYVDVVDPGILRDIDVPEDYQALLSARLG